MANQIVGQPLKFHLTYKMASGAHPSARGPVTVDARFSNGQEPPIKATVTQSPQDSAVFTVIPWSAGKYSITATDANGDGKSKILDIAADNIDDIELQGPTN